MRGTKPLTPPPKRKPEAIEAARRWGGRELRAFVRAVHDGEYKALAADLEGVDGPNFFKFFVDAPDGDNALKMMLGWQVGGRDIPGRFSSRKGGKGAEG